MIYPDKKSALVRLTDSLKVTLDCCSETTSEVLAIFERHKPALENLRRVAASVDKDEAPYSDLEKANADIPEADVRVAAYLQVRLHGQSLAPILLSCFCLESYVNSLAYFLFGDANYLGLSRERHAAAATAILDTIERMAARTKWEFVGSSPLRPTGQWSLKSTICWNSSPSSFTGITTSRRGVTTAARRAFKTSAANTAMPDCKGSLTTTACSRRRPMGS